MIDTKKEQERDELHRAIWAIADELRGAVDGWDFKNYVLGTMFYRYISENLCNYINEGEAEAGNTDFDFAVMPDEDAEEAREGLVEEKGFFILPSELFCNVRARAAEDENLNETLERVFRHIEDGRIRTDVREIINTLCQYKNVEIIAGAVCVDHVHPSVAIPPKISISNFMGYLKGKSTLMIYDRHPELQSKWDKTFWARGYYVETIGNIIGACRRTNKLGLL